MKRKILDIQSAYRWGAKRLEEAGVREYQLDAWLLLEYVTGISKASYYADPGREISEEESETYCSYIERRGKKIPLQHITGEQMFMGLPFIVNEHVLVPRQDTEILVEAALDVIDAEFSNKTGAETPEMESPEMPEMGKPGVPEIGNFGVQILDMCTGSGCILLSLLKLTKAKKVTGIGADISSEALKVARKNAENLEVLAEFVQGDLFEPIPEGRKFDLIVSNPPYIRTAVIEELDEEVRCHDPHIALDGKEDGLYFYRKIIKESIPHIKSGGYLLFEIGYDQGKDVTELLEAAGYTQISIKKDFAALDRVVIGMYNGK